MPEVKNVRIPADIHEMVASAAQAKGRTWIGQLRVIVDRPITEESTRLNLELDRVAAERDAWARKAAELEGQLAELAASGLNEVSKGRPKREKSQVSVPERPMTANEKMRLRQAQNAEMARRLGKESRSIETTSEDGYGRDPVTGKCLHPRGRRLGPGCGLCGADKV